MPVFSFLKYSKHMIKPYGMRILRSGERLFSLVKRLLDNNQQLRAEVMTAIAKIRATNEDPLYFL